MLRRPYGGEAEGTANDGEKRGFLLTSGKCEGRRKTGAREQLYKGQRGPDAVAATRREPGPNGLVALMGSWPRGRLRGFGAWVFWTCLSADAEGEGRTRRDRETKTTRALRASDIAEF